MKLVDRQGALSRGLADIRTQFAVPSSFPAEVLAEAEAAAAMPIASRADWTSRSFVTLDPATSTDLDQAFAIERSGQDIILYYAIADTAWFVSPAGALDREAWTRGETIYLPDGRVPLHPTVLSEGALSLLPDQTRASHATSHLMSLVFVVRGVRMKRVSPRREPWRGSPRRRRRGCERCRAAPHRPRRRRREAASSRCARTP